jgi:hypothetical protein
MAWTFNGVGSQVRLPDSAALDIPNDDWSFCGWFRVASNSDSNYKRLLAWGTAGGSPHVQVFLPGSGLGVSNADYLSARIISGGDTAVIFPTGMAISSFTNQWIAWSLSHDNSANLTYLRVLDRSSASFYSASKSATLSSINIAEDIYLGANNGGANADRFVGDMAEIAYFPGLYMDVDVFHGWVHGGRSHRFSSCSWYVPMLPNRTEEWINQATLNTVNIAKTVYNGPQLQISSPMLDEPSETAVTPATDVEVAQHHVQVVGSPTQATSNLYVRRLYAEVLISVSPVVHEESVTSNLALTDEVIRLQAGDTSSTLDLTHIVSHFNYVADRSPVEQTLNLTQTVQTLSALSVNHTLNFSQTVNYSAPTYLTIVQALVLTSSTSTPHRQWVSQNLGISHFLNTPLPLQHVTHTLNFTHDSPIGRVDDTLNLTHSVWFAFSYEATSTLNLTQNVQMNADWARSVEHTNFIGHALTWYEDTPCGQKQYTPFQGESTIPGSTVTAPEENLQDPQGDTGNFSLRTPPLGTPTSQVILRNPELDNRDRNAFTRINNETRGGKLVVYADPTWPTVRTLAVTIVGLIETEVDGLHTFMQSTLGQEIGLTDWEGRLWKGVITNPNEAATQDGKGKWVVTFEFEGEMLDVEQPDGNDGSTLAFTQTVTAVIE